MVQQEVEHLQKLDQGTVLYLEIKDEDGDAVNLSTATKQIIKVFKPASGVTDMHFATIHDAPGGIIKHTLVDDDLEEPDSLYEAQAYIESPLWSGHSTTKFFYVDDNLPWPSRASVVPAYMLGA